MTPKFWRNDHTSLFLIRQGGPLHMTYIAVKSVDWGGSIVLRGILPAAGVLNEIEDGATFEILYKGAGAPDEYDAREVIMRMSDCKIAHKFIRDLIAMSPADVEPVEMTLVLDCNIDLFIIPTIAQ